MPSNIKIDFSDTYTLMRLVRDIPPETQFFRDRYFPTGAGDLFKQKKIPVSFQDGDFEMAPFVSRRMGPIEVEREGFEVYEFEPAFISVQRTINPDDLEVPMFGEQFFENKDEARRAIELAAADMIKLDKMISRREEWLAVQTMLNNACTVQEYVDAKTRGKKKFLQFYRKSDKEHIYTVSKKWNDAKAEVDIDVQEMCQMVADHNGDPQDIILGPQAWRAVRKSESIIRTLDKTIDFNNSAVNEKYIKHGVAFAGKLQFGAYLLNTFVVSTKYSDENKKLQPYFPVNGALVTFPKCGHTMYGSVLQQPFGSVQYKKFTAARIPKFVNRNESDQNAWILKSAPLTAPRTYCPYAFAPNVVDD